MGGDEEASGLYEEAIKLHNQELCPLAAKVEALVLETVQAKNRQDSAVQISNVGRLKVKKTLLIQLDIWSEAL